MKSPTPADSSSALALWGPTGAGFIPTLGSGLLPCVRKDGTPRSRSKRSGPRGPFHAPSVRGPPCGPHKPTHGDSDRLGHLPRVTWQQSGA